MGTDYLPRVPSDTPISGLVPVAWDRFHTKVKDAIDGVPTWTLISVKDAPYGAKGDGVTDDSKAVQKAFDAAAKIGAGSVYFPPSAKPYLLSPAITCANTNLHIFGAGQGLSTLKWTAAGGFAFTFADIRTNLTMHDLTLSAGIVNGGTAISATWPATASSSFSNCLLHDLEINSFDEFNAYWTRGINLSDAWNGLIQSVWIRGKDNDLSMAHGIRLQGESTAVAIRDCTLYFMSTGIRVEGTCEGAVVHGSTIVYVNSGIVFNTPAGEAEAIVAHNHIAAFSAGVLLTNRPQTRISGNLIYKRSDGTGAFVGIQVNSGSDDTIIDHNQIRERSAVGGQNGIVVISGDRIQIRGNLLRDQDTAIWLQAGANNCDVHGNKASGTMTTTVLNQGTNNVLRDNFPVDAVQEGNFPDLATTPTIDGVQTNTWNANNTGPTAITNFLRGYTGQRIRIRTTTANTTFVNGATLDLQGGVNYNPLAGAIVTFQLFAVGIWREIARRVP